MLNCMATYRRQDKKPVDNKMDAIGIANTFERGDAIGNVIEMGSAAKALGSVANNSVDALSDLLDSHAALFRTAETAGSTYNALGSIGEHRRFM